jgi:gliding motility-associated-like protein
VVVLKDALVFLPNAFTPNGDGVNDWFGPAGKVPADYQMQIYNRYGELVFRSSSINNRWDGRYKGALQPTNTFIYVISYKDMQNQPVVKKGTFTLIH